MATSSNSGGGASTISFGDYVPSPQQVQRRKPRIVGGKIIGANYPADWDGSTQETTAAPQPAQPTYTSHSTSGNIFAHGAPAQALSGPHPFCAVPMK